MMKKAMILAAGLGTRLGDITLLKPKALVEVGGMPMLHRLLLKLKNAGVEEVMINVHHHAQQIMDSILKNDGFGLKILFSDESAQLLDTGGALVAAKDFFNGSNPILIHNADILTDVNLSQMLQFHTQNKARATLFVSDRKSSRSLLFDEGNQLAGWTNHNTQAFKWVNHPLPSYRALSFNGIWMVEPSFVQALPFSGKFSIIDGWLAMAKDHSIVGYQVDTCPWFDLGSPEKLVLAESFLTQNKR